MRVRALLIAALFFVPTGAASAAPSHLWSPAAPAIAVRAGVGGAARPGRWLPVDVTVSSEAALNGTVTVEWGGAVARREISLDAASSERITILIRTIAASPNVRVSLTTSDGNVAVADTPLTLLPVDEPLRLCIGDVPDSVECLIRIGDSEAPANARALDLADEVVWPARRVELPREPSRALSLWQATRWWQDSGSVDPVVQPFDRISRLSDRTALSLALFVGVLLFATTLAAWRRASAILLAGIPFAVSMAGVAVVTRSSRDVDIQSASFVHQFAGVSQSVVRMKAEVEHPGSEPVVLTPALTDASIDMLHGLQNTESVVTADGQTIYRNTAGRGARSRFELNGSLDREWLSVTTADGLVIRNNAPFSMSECQLRSDDVVDIGPIAAGAIARITRAGLAPGDTIVCVIPPNWLEWKSPGANVRTRGSAFLVFHAWPGAASAQETHAAR